MINKKFFNIFLFLIFCGMGLSSCSYFNKKLAQKPTSPTVREETCKGLQRQITFDRSDMNAAANNSAEPTDEAKMAEDYKKNECTDFEAQ